MFVKAKLTTYYRKLVGEGGPKCEQSLKIRLSTGRFLGVNP